MKCFFRRPLKSFRDEVKMKEELKIRFLSDLIDFKNGKSIKPSSGNIPIYGGNGILGYSEKYNYNNILIIGRVGAYCGSIHYHKEKCWVSDNAIAGEVKSDYSIDYLYYLMKSLNLNDRQVGSSQPLLTQGVLNNISVKIYESSQTQQSIAAVLSALDKKITLNKQINARLEEMAKTLYDYWFVQFDFPDANGKPYKSSGGEMVFDETLKREIPKGWEVKNLGDWAEIRKGTLITEKTANTNGDIKVISAGVDFSYYHDVANRPKNTITISASGANAGFVNFWREPIFACDCTTITNRVIGSTLYILNFLKIVQDFIYQQARGSAQPHVYPKDIEGLKIIVPPDLLLKRFSEFVENWNLKIANNEKQNHQLTQLRDFLLPMLMNGQVSVAE